LALASGNRQHEAYAPLIRLKADHGAVRLRRKGKAICSITVAGLWIAIGIHQTLNFALDELDRPAEKPLQASDAPLVDLQLRRLGRFVASCRRTWLIM
jgi:hypothetical protein